MTPTNPDSPPAPRNTPAQTPATASAAIRRFLAYRSPQILLLAALAAWSLRLAYGQWSPVDLIVAISLLLYWPLNEWLIHVLILHWRPRPWRGRMWDLPVARDHRRHHQDPWNLNWVFIPLHVYPWALPLLLIVGWLIPSTPAALSFVAAYLTLALHYEWSHFLAHIQWTPPLRHYQRRVHEHRLHHFRNHHYWWGVSMGSADRWLRTAPEQGSVSKSGRLLHQPTVSKH